MTVRRARQARRRARPAAQNTPMWLVIGELALSLYDRSGRGNWVGTGRPP